MTKNTFSHKLSSLLFEGRYEEAKVLLEKKLTTNKNDAWLQSNYAIVLYELREYKKALRYSSKVVEKNNTDPLFLNYHAAILTANDRVKEGIGIWKYLLKRDVSKLAYEDCKEGLGWVNSLLNDIRFNLASIYKELKDIKQAKKYIQEHLKNRRSGRLSIYSKKEVIQLRNEIFIS